MQTPITEKVRWTTADLDLLPDNGNRYEIIEGELFVARAPHWKHQQVADNICTDLKRQLIPRARKNGATKN
ncbi:Uma2 family endonuclease [Gloeothece verrucosa]|uniref:Restriction endonuclease domain-containing protein n=1 Tax=Gloeothece verrucosa (strain PCC 7822) TaxID=497965 RepID=E0U798_GLOV7|nr:hypothetical protein Cyan7822_0440 [Gloeothece verrucosa PCC 7822]